MEEPIVLKATLSSNPPSPRYFYLNKKDWKVVADDDESTLSTFSQASQSSSTMSSTSSYSINPYPQHQSGQLTLSQILGKQWLPIQEELTKIIDDEDETTISMFRSLYDTGVPKIMLYAIANLSVATVWDEDHEKAVESLAYFLVISNISYREKLGCIRTLMALSTPIDAAWQLEEACLKETLDFIILREQEWMLPEHSESMLLWDLRARALRFQHLNNAYHLEVEDVVKGGEVTADYIATAAKCFSRSLKWSVVPVIHYGLDIAGDNAKRLLTPVEHQKTRRKGALMTVCKNPTSVRAIANCTTVIRQVSNGVRLQAKQMSSEIRDIPNQGFQMVVKKVEDEELVEKLVPDEDHREVLAAAGKIGVASVGAAAIVSEAIIDTSSSIVRKTASVTADVVRHKYGDSAGQIVKDTSDTTGNILRTVGHLTGMNPNPKGMTKMVAKNVSKDRIQNVVGNDELKEQMPIVPLLIIDSDKKEANIAVKKLQKTIYRKKIEAEVVLI
mmetsp:Transcript_37333/g.42666  ORF Transcript_37333/g.42666 Transcript_37333/m.42666 type:complete len:502 (-) Transcript_37333:323-1828(-)